MRRAWVALVVVLLAGCGTPRERDCRVIMPRVEEAVASTGLAGNVGRDASRYLGNRAARSDAAIRWIESATLEAPEVVRELPTIVDALTRHSVAAKRGDVALRAVGFHTSAGTTMDPVLSRLLAPESREQPAILGGAVTLNERCGFLLTDPAADHPECTALINAVGHFLAPAEGATTAAHVADTLAELAAIHSPDARVEAVLRSIEPLAHALGAMLETAAGEKPASVMIVHLRALTAALRDMQLATRAISSSAATVRATCSGAARGPGP